MMLVNRREFKVAVQNATKVFNGGNKLLPQGINLHAVNGKLSVFAVSQMFTVKTIVPYQGDDECNIFVPYEKLMNAVTKMDASDTLQLQVEDKLKISCGYASLKIATLFNEDGAQGTERTLEGLKKASVKLKNIAGMLEATEHALDTSNNNVLMMAYDVAIAKSGAKITTLDGHRISQRNSITNGELPEADIIVPGKPFKAAVQMMGEDDIIVSFTEDGKFIQLSNENETVVTTISLHAGPYFNIEAIVRTAPNMNTEITLDREQAIQALTINALCGRTSVISIKDNAMLFESADQSTGNEASASIEVAGKTAGIRFGVNNQYLMDALKSFDSEKVSFAMENPKSPMFITDGTENKEVVLPVNIIR